MVNRIFAGSLHRSSALLYCFILLGMLHPLLFRLIEVPFFDRLKSPFPNFTNDLDVFAMVKLVFLLILTLIIVIISLHKNIISIIRNHVHRQILGAILAFFFLAFISTAYSPYWRTAIVGFPGHYEGFLAISCYCIVFLSALSHYWCHDQVKVIVYALLLGALIVSLIGLLQYFDVWQLDRGWVRKWSFGALANHPGIQIKLYHTHKGEISSTLYNPNFVGSFCALIIPLTFSIYLASDTKHHKAIVFWFILKVPPLNLWV